MSSDLLQAMVVPTCFVLAGLLGLRLGTPRTVALSVVLVGGLHLAGLAVAAEAGDVAGSAGTALHVLSQVLFAGGFAALVGTSLTYPWGGRPPALVWGAAALAVLGPVTASLAGLYSQIAILAASRASRCLSSLSRSACSVDFRSVTSSIVPT